VEGIAVCKLTAKDVVRHPLVMRIIRAYEKAEEQKQPQKTKEKSVAREKDAEGEV
jgi:phosphate starvation-inducible PhoH-like protein